MPMSKLLKDWFTKEAHDIQVNITNEQNSKSPLLANELMGRYGIRDAKELLEFLKSPGGKSLKSLISRKLAELEALIQAGLKTLEAKQHARALAMLILGLAYQKEAAADKLGEILEQKRLDKILHPQKKANQDTIITQSMHAASAAAYAESIAALNTTLAEKTARITAADMEWDALDADYKAQQQRHAFLDEILSDFTRLFSLNDDEELYLDQLYEKPELQHTFEAKKLIQKNGKIYLIDKEDDFDDLSGEDRDSAEKAYLTLKPKLERVLKLTQKEEEEYHEKRKADLIHRITRLHEDIRIVTQQLSLIRHAVQSLDLKIQQQLNQDTRPLSTSYKALYKAFLHTSSARQARPISAALLEDANTLDYRSRLMNEAGMPEPSAPRLLAELHSFKQGANNITSAAQTQQQTLLSMLKNAESLASLMSEAPSARQFHMEEAKNTPKPRPALKPTAQPVEEEQPEEKPTFNPKPFRITPY